MAESLEAEIRQLYEDWIANPSPVVCARLADRLRIAGRNDEALEVSRRGQKDWPGNNSIRMVIARCLRSSGDMQEARSAFEDVLKADPFNLVALKNLAEMSMDGGRYGDAVRLFGDYLFENPGDTEAQQQLEDAKRKEKTSPEPTPVPPVDEAASPPAASVTPLPVQAEAVVTAEPADTVEQAFAAGDDAPPESSSRPVPPAVVREPAAAEASVSSLQSMFGEPGAETGPVPRPVEAQALIAENIAAEEPEPDAASAPEPAAAQAPEPAAAQAPEPDAASAPEPSAAQAPAPEPEAVVSSEPAPGHGQAQTPAQEPPVSEEAAPPAPFPQTGRMERILRNQGMAIPEARPAAPEPVPQVRAPEHSPEPRAAQGLKREPRSLFDLFSPEERAELFLEPYRQEEK